MKKKVAILGSTGSIGKSTIDIIRKDKKNFDVVLLTTNNNYKEILRQSREFKVHNIVINNSDHYLYLKKKLKNKKINIFNNFDSFNKSFKNKIDFTMSAISGLEGLKPTLNIIKHSKTIAITNKESIILLPGFSNSFSYLSFQDEQFEYATTHDRLLSPTGELGRYLMD